MQGNATWTSIRYRINHNCKDINIKNMNNNVNDIVFNTYIGYVEGLYDLIWNVVLI